MNKRLTSWVGRLALVFVISTAMALPVLAVQAGATPSASTYAQTHKAIPAISAAGSSVTVQPMSGSTRVYITRTGSKYHRSGCRYLRQSKIAKTLSWVKAHHYGACKICRPPTR